MTTERGSRRSHPREAKSASALLTVSREAPTSWASSSWVRSWATSTPSSTGRPKRAARSSRALATRPGTSVKTRSASTSLVRRSRRASAASSVDATFASLSHDDLLRWLEGRPVVARGLLSQIASRLRKANDVNADLVFSDVPGRVAKALLDLADRFGRTADDGVHVHHDLTQEELAQLVGASRETVNKALADFASRGWLRLDGKSVIIMDPERLARRARV